MFFSTSKSFSTFFSSIFLKKNVSKAFFVRSVSVLLKSRVIIKIKFTIITIMFFNLFCKMNKQISSSNFFYNQNVLTIRRLNWFFKTIIYFEIIFSENKNSSKLMFIKRDRFYEIMQIIMIRQNLNKVMIILKIISLLLKCCNNKQEFLIMHFVSDFNGNHFL